MSEHMKRRLAALRHVLRFHNAHPELGLAHEQSGQVWFYFHGLSGAFDMNAARTTLSADGVTGWVSDWNDDRTRSQALHPDGTTIVLWVSAS